VPIERQRWRDVSAWDALNAMAKRIVDVLDTNDRHDVRAISASTTLSLTRPRTHLRVTTSGGSVTVTLPSSASLLGFELTVKKMSAANTMTLAASGTDTIDGGASVATTTQYYSFTVRAVSGGWDLV